MIRGAARPTATAPACRTRHPASRKDQCRRGNQADRKIRPRLPQLLPAGVARRVSKRPSVRRSAAGQSVRQSYPSVLGGPVNSSGHAGPLDRPAPVHLRRPRSPPQPDPRQPVVDHGQQGDGITASRTANAVGRTSRRGIQIARSLRDGNAYRAHRAADRRRSRRRRPITRESRRKAKHVSGMPSAIPIFAPIAVAKGSFARAAAFSRKSNARGSYCGGPQPLARAAYQATEKQIHPATASTTHKTTALPSKSPTCRGRLRRTKAARCVRGSPFPSVSSVKEAAPLPIA